MPKKELTQLLVHNTPVAYIILDEEYRIHFINDNFLQLRKLKKELTLGEICYNISNNGKHCNYCVVEKALSTKTKAFTRRKDVLPDGTIRYIDDYAIPLQHDSEDNKRYVLEIMVNRTQEMLSREQRDKKYHEILSILSSLIEAKDQYTAKHSHSVEVMSIKLASAMGLSEKQLFEISIASTLHDIGKVHIPIEIINKPARLTDEEYRIIKTHPAHSYEMLYGFKSLENIRKAVRHHHERFDGCGYPDGLAGKDIPLKARIISVADTYDAMVSTRSYRTALSHEYALQEIQRGAGTQFDPDIVDTFIKMDFSSDAPLHKQTIERILDKKQVYSIELSQTDTKQTSDKTEFSQTVHLEHFLSEILNNTPCGYVLMNTDRTVVYASQYFLDFMGLTEAEVIGKKCYDASGVGGTPCVPCAIKEALKSGKIAYMRQEQQTKKGLKTFDMFGMPVPNPGGEIEYVIEIVIDRTEEIQVERQHEVDFEKLIDMLEDVVNSQEHSSSEAKLSEDVAELRQRLSELMATDAG